VQQVCFHGPSALARGQQVLFVTERAVFELTPRGLVLTEVAPGIDVGKHILPLMEFAPAIDSPRTMPAECFTVS
jgi:propionate CoA-transferase